MEIVIASKDDNRIIKSYADAIKFPDYWNYNWNSFDECIRDFLSNGHVLHVVHQYPCQELDSKSIYSKELRDLSSEFDTFSYEFES